MFQKLGMPKRKNESEDAASASPSEDKIPEFNCIDLDVQIDPKKLDIITRSHAFINDVLWQTKSCFFKVLDAAHAYPKDELCTLKISYTREGTRTEPFGRLKSTPDINGLWRPVKQAMLHEFYYDIDIKSCHAAILLYLNDKTYRLRLPNIEQLVNHKETCINIIQQEYNVSKDTAKKFLTGLLYGQGYKSFWAEQCPGYVGKKIALVNDIKSEVTQLMSNMKKESFWEDCKAHMEHKEDTKPPGEKSKNSADYQTLSCYLQTVECNILLDAIDHMRTKTPCSYIVPAHDGFYVDKKGIKNMDFFLEQLNIMVSNKYSRHIQFVCKPMTEMLDTSKLTNINFYNKHIQDYIPELTVSLGKELTTDFKIHPYKSLKYMWNGHIWTSDATEHKRIVSSKIHETIEIAMSLQKKFYLGSPDKVYVHTYDKKLKEWSWVEHHSEWPGIRYQWDKCIKSYLSGSNNRELCTCLYESCCEKDKGDIFDLNPYIFCFNNAYYNLITGEFSDPSREAYMSMTCGYDYDRTHKYDPSVVEKFFYDVMEDPDDRQNLMWWCATGLVGQHYERFYLALGDGGNGKSVLSLWMKYMLGDYFYNMPVAALFAKETNGPNENVARSHLKRYIVLSEPPAEGEKFSETRLKAWTGAPTVSARGNYECVRDIKIQGSLTIEANNLPPVHIADKSFARRFLGAKFKTFFTDRVDHYRAQFMKDDLPMTRVKQGNAEYSTVAFAKKIRQDLFLLLASQFQSFYANKEKFIHVGSALVLSFCEVEESPDYSDPYESPSNWFRANYKFIPEVIKDKRPELIDQLEYIFDLAYGKKLSKTSKGNPCVLNVISVSVNDVYKHFQNDYLVTKSIDKKSFKRDAFNQMFYKMPLVCDHIIEKGKTFMFNTHKLEWKDCLEHFFTSPRGAQHKDTYILRYGRKAFADTNCDRIVNYICVDSTLWAHYKPTHDNLTLDKNIMLHPPEDLSEVAKEQVVEEEIVDEKQVAEEEIVDEEMIPSSSGGDWFPLHQELNIEPPQREASPESSRTTSTPWQDGME